MLLHRENYGTDYYPRLISLSEVCLRWYKIIRDSPPLWTGIHGLDSPELIDTALLRSSRHPLDTIFHSTKHRRHLSTDFFSFMTAINGHRDRWRSMEILAPRAWMQGVIASLGGLVPNLEELSLIDRDTISCSRKFDLFGGKAPRLDSLTLNGVSIRWDSEILHNLTCLDLSWIAFPSTDVILHALSRSPQLQKLRINSCTIDSMATPPSRSVQLPRLLRLSVDLRDQAVTENLLSCIQSNQKNAL
ncbi:hypothetical protein M407DRAFT_27940 [Tulasnella calospora MUT 4182]|uniref:F-box domain-containing protein n=1 Tax=Tulasnella calospora MUT 4182 TaxID=1051891 RepID=A0A0C3Q2A3_9AGAM|nr:hypothetical protein M407DRAFT_27940 [Tulasnella calospora MUT 4182]